MAVAVKEIEELEVDETPLDFIAIDGLHEDYIEDGPWTFDEEDWLLYALITDPIYMPELLWKDPQNREYAGCYRVRDYQYILNRHRSSYAIFACARSVGKALADDALVLTPGGYVAISSLRVGDLVVGSGGLPTSVLGVYPQGQRDLWAVTFTDGAVVECDDEHLWTVTCDTWKGRPPQERTLRLRELRERRAKFKVRLPSAPVEFLPVAEPEIDPWLVGALLGDGNLTRSTMVRFASVDEENVERFRLALPIDAELVRDGGCNFRVRGRERIHATGTRGRGRSRVTHRLLDWSRKTGLQGLAAHQKHVPHEYLWGSVATRLAVLRGLVDTDGSVTHAGSVEISSASGQLAKDIRHLVLSLGGRASINRGTTPRRERFRVVLRLPHLNPCLLSRKALLYDTRGATRVRDCDWRGIASIEPSRTAGATCIQVAAADGLFMANDMVLTHNTESEKVHAQIHGFDGDSEGENMLITAPELIHLLPLTDAIEENIRDSRMLTDCLDTRGGQTGFTHRPFGVNWIDGTKLVGRIPKVTGTGVKGQHQRKLIVEEGQDYPEKGWIEVNETVNYDSTDRDGRESFRFWVYGVHSGDKSSGFDEKARSSVWRKIQVTALMRPDWNKARKENAIAAYGGSSSPDYRRNILGEPGAGASKYFVTARVMACVDQQVERPPDQKGSHYNTIEYVAQTFRGEELDTLGMSIADILDLPEPAEYQRVWAGVDVGLTDSPTVITIWGDKPVAKKPRRVLIRRFTLERFRPKDIRKALYTIAWHFGATLAGVGIDITGLGFPMFQDIEDDELCPPRLLEVSAGYMFNAKVAVGIDPNMTTVNQGVMRDQYGNMVKEIEDPTTGEKRYIVSMPFIAASTRYVREDFDSGFYLLPFDTDVIKDILGETKQRVEKIGQREGTVKKGDRFHVLDAIRAMAMRAKAEEIEAAIAVPEQQPVLDYAM